MTRNIFISQKRSRQTQISNLKQHHKNFTPKIFKAAFDWLEAEPLANETLALKSMLTDYDFNLGFS